MNQTWLECTRYDLSAPELKGNIFNLNDRLHCLYKEPVFILKVHYVSLISCAMGALLDSVNE